MESHVWIWGFCNELINKRSTSLNLNPIFLRNKKPFGYSFAATVASWPGAFLDLVASFLGFSYVQPTVQSDLNAREDLGTMLDYFILQNFIGANSELFITGDKDLLSSSIVCKGKLLFPVILFFNRPGSSELDNFLSCFSSTSSWPVRLIRPGSLESILLESIMFLRLFDCS